MKVFITTKPQEAPKDYLIVDFKDFDSIDTLVDDGEAQELILDNILEYFTFKNLHITVAAMAKKIKHGGNIIVNGTDIYLISKSFIESQIDINNFNIFIYGSEDEPVKKTMVSIQDINKILISFGLKIIHRRVDSYRYSVKAQRL